MQRKKIIILTENAFEYNNTTTTCKKSQQLNKKIKINSVNNDNIFCKTTKMIYMHSLHSKIFKTQGNLLNKLN